MSTFDLPDSVKLGRCDLIEEVIIGEDKLLKFSGLYSFKKESLRTKKVLHSLLFASCLLYGAIYS